MAGAVLTGSFVLSVLFLLHFLSREKRFNAVAQEITLTASLSAYKAAIMSSAIGRSVTGKLMTMSGSTLVQGVVSIGTSPTAFPLGQVTAPHWAWFNNLDANNYFTLRNGSAGADLGQLFAGEESPFPLLSTCVPYGVANTSAVLVEYLIFSL